MQFAKRVWIWLLAIKDGLVLLLLLLFFMALYAALSARPGPEAVHGGALLLKLRGAVVEEPRLADPWSMLTSRGSALHETRARDLSRAIQAAAKDDRIKAVVLDLTGFTGGGQVHIEEIGAAMDAVRAAHKPVLTWATLYTDSGVMLAAHASEAWVDPMGGAVVMGPGGNHLYYADLLKKLKIDVHIFKVGTYKDFVEPYSRSAQSEPSRAARKALYDALWRHWQADVTKARPKANLALVTHDPVAWVKASGGNLAEAARSAGLIDHLGSHVEFGERVAALVGKDDFDKRPGNFAHTSLAAWLADIRPGTPGKAIGVITIAGEIVDGKAGPGSAGGARISRLLDAALEQDLAGLVIRVDSPGGSVSASEQIRQAIERVKAQHIPVAVSMGNLAASGGYWVSTPGTHIFAQPATITGSIGIFAIVPSFEHLLAANGVHGDGVRTTPLSGQPDPLTGLTPEVEAMLQANIENGYARFIGLVGKARGKTPEQIDAIAQGRVWDGSAAKANGLIDQFGGLDEALAYVAGQANLHPGEWHPLFLGRGGSAYASLLDQLSGDDDSDDADAHDWAGLIAARQQAGLLEAWAGIKHMIATRGAQALCMDCGV